MRTVSVFCSSSDDVAPVFYSEVEKLAHCLVENGIQVLYGGAKHGLMGRLAQVALGKRGRVVGVIPEMFNTEPVRQSGLNQLHVTKDLFERKKKLIELGDAYIVFPGGFGTMDEALEVITLKQIGCLQGPIIFYNVFDFWTPLLQSFFLIKEQGMISQRLSDLYVEVETSQQAVEYLNCFFSQNK